MLAPPHQLWLAGLGGTALALRGVRATWTLLVDEGGHVEGWLRRALVIGAGREAPDETSV